MDENFRLPEWIAYHYYMMPLRHLVLLVDPRSATSPLDIVERWRPYMKIQVWSDASFGFVPNNRTDPNGLIQAHRRRQDLFYRACAKHFQQDHVNQTTQNHENASSSASASNATTTTTSRAWVSFHDVDEYASLDPLVVPDALERMSRPGSMLQFLQDMEEQHQQREQDLRGDPSFLELPGDPDHRTLDLPKKALETGATAIASSCWMVPRTYFGATDESLDHVQSQIPTALLQQQLHLVSLETLRWQHRTTHWDYQNNGVGKSWVDVSTALLARAKPGGGRTKKKQGDQGPKAAKQQQPQPSSTIKSGFSGGPHRILNQCPFPPPPREPAPIRLRHYLGSWDAYMGRVQDARAGRFRNLQLYEYRSELGRETPPDTAIQHWFHGFCQEFHNNWTLITHLLEGSGQQLPWKADSSLLSSSSAATTLADYFAKLVQRQETLMQHAREDDRHAWQLQPENIKEEIDRMYVENQKNFASWLHDHYAIHSLANGTVLAIRQTK